MNSFDYYRELGVSKDATAEEIRSAFRRLALQYHPDRNPGDKFAEQRFKRIAEAYDVLSDAEKRAAYDRGGIETVKAEKGFRAFESVDDIFTSFGDVLDEFFADRARRETPPRPGQDYETEIRLTAAEAASGGRKSFTIEEETACGVCGGSGTAGDPNSACPLCRGRGVVREQGHRHGGFFSVTSTCPECGGRGESSRSCKRCGGQGIHAGPREVELFVPRGIEDGTVLRLRGLGAPSSGRGTPGDLLVRVRVVDGGGPVPTAARRATIDLVTAALGGILRVPLSSGTAEIRIPAGTQPGQVFRVRDGRGETLVTVDVEIPRDLSDRQRRLLEEFRRFRP